MKACNKCSNVRELTQYGKDKRNADGLQGICNQCKQDANKALRDKRVEAKTYVVRTEKSCSKCSEVKPIDGFFRDKAMPDGHSTICKVCKNAKTYEWRKNNKPKYNALAVKWRDRNPEKQHATDIKRNYGLSIEHYNEMLTLQACKCKICGKAHDPSIKRGRLYVDHCHTSGEVRGLLCGACNSAIGYFENNPETLTKAIAYLASYKKSP